MEIFFTSDTHFGHANMLRFENLNHSRGQYSNVYEVDQVIIDNWNSVVKKTDCIYHLGDFFFCSPK